MTEHSRNLPSNGGHQTDIVSTCTRSHALLVLGVDLRPGVQLDLIAGEPIVERLVA